MALYEVSHGPMANYLIEVMAMTLQLIDTNTLQWTDFWNSTFHYLSELSKRRVEWNRVEHFGYSKPRLSTSNVLMLLNDGSYWPELRISPSASETCWTNFGQWHLPNSSGSEHLHPPDLCTLTLRTAPCHSIFEESFDPWAARPCTLTLLGAASSEETTSKGVKDPC